MLKSSSDLLSLVMTWKIWCPEVFLINWGISWALFAQMPFIHSLCETYWGLRSVRCALQESDPLIYRTLIRLALWRFYQANDEISPSFCLSLPLFCQPAVPSPGNSVSVLNPHWPPPSPHPALKLWCSSWVSAHLPYIATGAPPQVLFEPRVGCGLNISWTVSLPSLHNALLISTSLLYYSPD